MQEYFEADSMMMLSLFVLQCVVPLSQINRRRLWKRSQVQYTPLELMQPGAFYQGFYVWFDINSMTGVDDVYFVWRLTRLLFQIQIGW